jgi:amino acid adenylation domain-containing protein
MHTSSRRIHERLWTLDGDAIVDATGIVTYARFRARVTEVAGEFRAAGVGPGCAVMVALPRSADAAVALFAVWASEAVAICVDPAWPLGRIVNIADRTRALVILTDEAVAARLAARGLVSRPLGQRYLVRNQPTSAAGPAAFASYPDAAYVIFTSGTTGVPKGAVISHQSFGNYLDWRNRILPIEPSLRVAAMASMGVDVMLRELVWPLTAGGCIVPLADEERGDTARLIQALRRHRIAIVHMLPSMLDVLLDEPDFGNLPDLRFLHAGAERLRWTTVRRFRQTCGAALHHGYGPTETTVSVTFFDCTTATEDGGDFVPLGRPIDNVTIEVTRDGAPVGPGAVGELYIRGASVGLGYFEDDAATASAFIESSSGERCYRSGDLGAVNPDGTLQFHGRVDDQLKVSGYRVEPGEIEAVLIAEPAVRDVVVIADGDALVALVQREPGSSASVRELQESAARVLPEYMVPRIEIADAIPRTPAGKADRQAVSKGLRAASGVPAGELTAGDPGQSIRELVLQAWREVVLRDDIGDDDDFFDLGGVSIHAMRIATRLRKIFGRHVDVRLVFDHPTVREMAAVISERVGAPPSTGPAAHSGGGPTGM